MGCIGHLNPSHNSLQHDLHINTKCASFITLQTFQITFQAEGVSSAVSFFGVFLVCFHCIYVHLAKWTQAGPQSYVSMETWYGLGIARPKKATPNLCVRNV